MPVVLIPQPCQHVRARVLHPDGKVRESGRCALCNRQVGP